MKRAHDPYKDMWALPGGFLNPDEEPSDAAMREVKEETGVDIVWVQFKKYYATPGRDPRGPTVSLLFWSHTPNIVKTAVAGDDAAEVGFFTVDRLPNTAFDHREMIWDCV